MTVRKVPLHSREAGEPPSPPTASERLELLAQLSEAGWQMTGRPFPTYERAEMPVRITTLAQQGRD